jgi:SAM-dependent methyltransferase
MKREYWDRLAGEYDTEVFSVCDHDKRNLIKSSITELASSSHSASDLGCGTGAFLPHLSSCFSTVTAVDLSPNLLDIAKEACAGFDNISYLNRDLSKQNPDLPLVELTLCVNTIITPSLQDRLTITDSVCSHILPGGHLVLVVPSLESAVFTDMRLIEWNLRAGMSPEHASGKSFNAYRPDAHPKLNQGLVNAGGAMTKHYLKEELITLLQSKDMQVLDITKIEYDWTTEFEEPPEWMTDPYPWDWLCIAQKTA